MNVRSSVVLCQGDIKGRFERLVESCRCGNIRMTQQRLAILRVVACSESHPDAEVVCEQVRERLPHVSLDTVYRTLASLERLGAIQKVSALHGAARYDANTCQHHHFICSSCGLIRDMHGIDLRPPTSNPGLCEWGEVSGVHAEFHGTCAVCLAAAKAVQCAVEQVPGCPNPSGNGVRVRVDPDAGNPFADCAGDLVDDGVE